MTERRHAIACFGGEVTVRSSGPRSAAALATGLLERVHTQLTPFEADSQLSRLNSDRRDVVPAGPMILWLAGAVGRAGSMSGGLVDATVGSPNPGDWRSVSVRGGSVARPAGIHLDPCGLAKGMAADLVARHLGRQESFAVECLGDTRVGGRAGRPRPVEVADPFGGDSPVAVLDLRRGAVATSGTTRRPGELIDPRTREPADTGIVQVTAQAPTGLEAEIRAKAALLSGPDGAAAHLPHGGVVVLSSGAVVWV
jgi:thiamine biosynthesis lipoprotein